MIYSKIKVLPTVTIADVAQQAGVSVSTVSRVLNDKPDVSERTRQRVQTVIETLGYTPYVQATGRFSRPLTITANYPLEHYTHADIPPMDISFFGGMGSAAGELGYTLNITTRHMTPEALLRPYEEGQIDGMIVMEVKQDDWRVDLLREAGCPFVMIGRCADYADLNFIDIDTDNGVSRLFEHLVNLGHRHIGFVAHPLNVIHEGFTPAVHGLRSYRDMVARHELEAYVQHAVFGPTGSFKAAETLLDNYKQLTALITMDGVGAPGIFRALQERGYRIPHDFSVAGCVVAASVAHMMIPTLTAIDFPASKIGYQAIHLFHQILDGESGGQILLKPDFFLNESTAQVS